MTHSLKEAIKLLSLHVSSKTSSHKDNFVEQRIKNADITNESTHITQIIKIKITKTESAKC